MTGYGPGAVVAWTIILVAALIVAALLVHWVSIRFEREVKARLEADRVERLERYRAAAFAAEEQARRRHPSAPAPIPADQMAFFDRVAREMNRFHDELADWDGTIE